jgi:hypothetical protein
MKKIISLLLSLSLLANTAIASDDITNLREDISDKLNSTVATLKEYFKKTNEKLIENKVSVDTAKETAQALKESSLEKETNPVVLKHGTASMPNCDTSIEELAWNGDNWACVKPSYGTDCYPAKDEYRYEEDGKIICSKSPQGESLNYYWKFRGHGFDCNTDAQKEKVYGCYYTNKLGAEVEVLDINCNGKSKPSADESICYANWQVGPWVYSKYITVDVYTGNSSSTHDFRTYPDPCSSGSRGVTCPANHICTGSKPETTKKPSMSSRECSGGKSDGR